MREQLKELRELMRKRGIGLYLIPMDDFHQSENVSDYFKTVQYISGFTGDSCQLVVTEEEACLFTDGRYFIQAEKELRGSGITLMRLGEKGVPTLLQYIDGRLPESGTLGFDGRCVDFALGSRLSTLALRKNAALRPDLDLAGELWTDRPALPENRVWILEERWSGRSSEDKLRRLREELAENGADIHVISSLDDIAWLLNLRGGDIPCTPVFLSYLLLDADSAYLFANRKSFPEEVRDYLRALGVKLCDYNGIYDAIRQLRNRSILLESGKTNYAILSGLDESMRVIDRLLPSSADKAVKNPTEVENERLAHLKDGIAVTKYFYFMKHAFDAEGRLTDRAKERLGADRLTEVNGAEYLERLRRELPNFVELSFPTISAYGENAALPHYSPDTENEVEILPHGLYLVDSGGHYFEGTTDITRTMAMGPLTPEERKHFTMVACAMLRLGAVQFLHGSCGVTLDYSAREIFWREGLNYNHGTGHGVGYLLGVHERPNGIRYRLVPERMDSAVLEPGHITSDEPGLYIEGSHGIRLENLVVCEKAFENEYGEFLRFDFLTMCPIDLDALDLTRMEPRDIALLNRYHQTVFEKLSPYFEGEELAWLREATRSAGI
ncbi:aminopeptidase P family N-terminal domain-containing protein [Oribacterium sp. oral taxon 102]|uniref:aminopeptidase P family N-terminal domain-containing protein n=1 Tax=Oribacterium sp. oral taxon 102 TaxID=671214 RepID=UPI0015BA3F3C|nr:aminopeptidase P family N-terminal domain-containing protein [Oribacterium sp. oral taxon 102]NWO21068.1 aminopeptidase P family N-terminal domain-containing protein [Oribacterium sp. oral taxon 102]